MRVYVSFNRATVDVDKDVDAAFMETVRGNIRAMGGVPVGELINDTLHLEEVIAKCDELWQCMRTCKDSSRSTKYEIPGAMMTFEKNCAERNKVPVVVRHFIFDF